MKILIDNGHGGLDMSGKPLTPGKRSVDGKHIEGVWAREQAERIVAELKARGYDASLLTPEQTDICVNERVRRINQKCTEFGSANVLVISVHNNARGDGKAWYDSTVGLSTHVSLNASTNSKDLATIIYRHARAQWKFGVRHPSAMQDYWTQNLGICRDSKCPAVLVEYGFMTSRTELEYMDSEDGKKAAVGLTVGAIQEYLRNHGAR